MLGGCCAVDALVLSSARDSDRAQQVVKNKIQIVFLTKNSAERNSPLDAVLNLTTRIKLNKL